MRLFCFVASLILLGPPLARSTSAQEVGLAVSADTVTVGERFSVIISARHDFASPANFPDPAVTDSLVLGDLEVLRLLGRGTRSDRAGRVDSVLYEVTTFALDTARIAPVPVLFTAGEDTFTVMTEEAFVPVASLVPQEADEIRDLAPLVEFPASSWRYVLAAAALLIVAALIAFLVWRRRKRRGESLPPEVVEPLIPPAEQALRRLKELEQMDVGRRESIRPFYIGLSDALRTYVSRRLGVHALERTTRELVDELRDRSVPDEETTSRIRTVLVQSDYVKFADAEPAADESRRLLGVTRQVIERIERQARPDSEEEWEPDVDWQPEEH